MSPVGGHTGHAPEDCLVITVVLNEEFPMKSLYVLLFALLMLVSVPADAGA